MAVLSPRAAVQIARAGDLRARLRAIRDGQAALRVAVVHAALRTGVLADVRAGRTTDELAARLGLDEVPLLEAYLRVLVAHGLLTTRAGRHRLTRRGAAVLDDGVVRAAYQAFGGFHGDLYRGLPEQLRGAPGRHDVEEDAGVIAGLSSAMAPLVRASLTREVRAAAPDHVLDVGCGDGTLLRHLLTAAPGARGTGVEIDDATATRAEVALAAAGLGERATVERGDVRDLVRAGRLSGPFGVVLLANVLYYVPSAERADFLRSLATLLAPGGRLVLITTVADRSPFSRHFDLLLHAQDPPMSLPGTGQIAAALAAADLDVVTSRRVTPGDALHVVAGARADRNRRRRSGALASTGRLGMRRSGGAATLAARIDHGRAS